jgi:RNA polymerase sigma-70 factor (ECF subfamily)
MEKRDIDILLFKRIQADDRLALNTLFTNYYQKLCAFANTFLRNQAESEEVVSDVFLNIWKQRFKLEIQKSLKTYLYVAVKHASLAELKKRQPIFEDVEEILLNLEWVSPDDPEQSIRLGELHYQINVAVECMPTRCRQVYKMSRVNELTYREISDILGISEKTVENHLIKALSLVRESLRRFERYELSALNRRLTIS